MPTIENRTGYPKPPNRSRLCQSKLNNEDLSRALNYVLCVTVPFCCAMTGYVVYVLLAPNICESTIARKVSDKSTEVIPKSYKLNHTVIDMWRQCFKYDCILIYPVSRVNMCKRPFRKKVKNIDMAALKPFIDDAAEHDDKFRTSLSYKLFKTGMKVISKSAEIVDTPFGAVVRNLGLLPGNITNQTQLVEPVNKSANQ